jgi:uncharacterized protein YukE
MVVVPTTKGTTMSVRVLSTDQGKAAITRMQAILNGGLAEQIAALKTQGQELSDPNVWDGLLASEFRADTWPATAAALDETAEALETLRASVQAVNVDIMSAGGNTY